MEALTRREMANVFLWSVALTHVVFFTVGMLKSRFVDQPSWRSGLEATALGGVAAALARALGALPAGPASELP